MEHLLNDQEDHPNQHKIGYKLFHQTGHPVVNMMGNQWKLRQQHKKNFPMEGHHCRTDTRIRRKKEIQKNRTVRITVWDPSRKVNHLRKVV